MGGGASAESNSAKESDVHHRPRPSIRLACKAPSVSKLSLDELKLLVSVSDQDDPYRMGEVEQNLQLKRMNELEARFQTRRTRIESEELLSANGRMAPRNSFTGTTAFGSPLAKAKICVSVMMQKLAKEREQDRALVFNTMIMTMGEDLTKLKRAVDCLGGRYDLSYLAFTFLKVKQRMGLLHHFQEQGQMVRAARERQVPGSPTLRVESLDTPSSESLDTRDEGAAAAIPGASEAVPLPKAATDITVTDIIDIPEIDGEEEASPPKKPPMSPAVPLPKEATDITVTDIIDTPEIDGEEEASPAKKPPISPTHIASNARWKPFQDDGRMLTCVLSDIDDTLYQSWVAGGPKYPMHCIFPGVQQLYTELGQFTSFITARPAAMKAHTLADFRKRLNLVYGFSLMTGKLADIMMMAVSQEKGKEMMGQTKYENFVRFQSLFPEYNFFWLGDSGQGDVQFALKAVENYPQKIMACFIHDITLKKDPVTPKTSLADRQQLARKGIYVVDNYVEAAHIAFRKGFIDAAALARITRAAQQDFLQTGKLKWHSVLLQKLAAKNLSDAIHEVNETLTARGLCSACVATLEAMGATVAEGMGTTRFNASPKS